MTSSSFLQGDLTSFRKAVANNNKQSIEKHLSHMKNLSEAELNQALFTCIDNFRIDQQTDQCLFLLLRNKANPNCQINGLTPLIAACKTAQITLVKNLIQNGAKPDLCNSEGKHPLQFVINARKQNYDVADYLISVMGSVNIEVGKETALVVSVEKEFSRIFKMLVERGASLMINDESILHVIMKRKFKDSSKKKKFLKEMANRWQLIQVKDKNDKLPIDYELDNQIKNYYLEIFKPKLKILTEKEHHLKAKQKESLNLSKQKELKKKLKDQEQKVVAEEEAVQEEENDEDGFVVNIHPEEKEKIVEVIEEEEDQRKAEEEKDKIKKGPSKVLTPNAVLNSKKILKPTLKNQKSSDRSFVLEKQKSKKVVNDKKKNKPQPNQNKNKSFSGLIRKVDVEQQKRQEEQKKKTSGRSSYREEDSKKINRKESQLKLEKVEVKLEELAEPKSEETIKGEEGSLLRRLSFYEEEQIQDMLKAMVDAVSLIFTKVEQKFSAFKEDQLSSEEELQKNQGQTQQSLTMQILQLLMVQQQKHNSSQSHINQIITYLENKMNFCLKSHTKHPFNLKIVVYGSQATSLSINQSDVDLLVITSQNPSELMEMFQFYKIFKEKQIVEVKFIKAASMPVIKLFMSQALMGFKVDITFQLRQHTGLRCAQLIEEFKAAQPLLKPLVIVVKQIIYAYSLADPYTGGLGSYSLTLMVVALLQLTQIEKKRQNLGRLFFQFLLFYGFHLDYVCQAIIVHPPISGFDTQPFYSIYQLPNTMDLTPKLVIYDPLNPVNNVGRTTYRIECLRNLFRVIYLRIKCSGLTIGDILHPQFLQLIQDAY